MEEKMYTCVTCDQEAPEEFFTTDIDAGQDEDSMTCEKCYNRMDESMFNED